MSRYMNPTGSKSKYFQTEHVYGTFPKEVVDAGLAMGEFLLFEMVTHAKFNGALVPSIDRRFMPASERAKQEAKGWKVVELSGAEKSASIPSETKKK